MFRFIHTSDLHLGKRFGQLPEELRGRLTEARHQSIENLAQLAEHENASAILVAGDLFDTGTPSPKMVRQALRAMGAKPSIKWVLLPGNHDSLAFDELWIGLKKEKPDNVILAVDNVAFEISPSVYILPAPCINRRPGRDLTQWMDTCETPEQAMRIGLAHGAIQSFGEEGSADIIDPNRAKNANLDYLALGDWHGQIQITDRIWYSGAPEPDRFKHNTPGKALIVAIESKGAKPVVTSKDIGLFDWRISDIALLPGEDLDLKLNAEFPAISKRRTTLQQVNLEGRLRLPERLKIDSLLDELDPDFAWMEIRKTNLANEYDAVDLDSIDQAGALRQAAETLFDKAQHDNDPNSASATALSLLYTFAAEET